MFINHILKSLKFTHEYDHIKEHILNSNPHKSGSPRDALTHGIRDFESYKWSINTIEVPLDVLSNLPQFGYGIHKGNLKRYIQKNKSGSVAPAIVIGVNEYGNIGILDGQHRVMSSIECGMSEIQAFIGISHLYLSALNEE